MLVDSSNSTAGSAVTGASRQAAQATGTSFQYLLATAQVESGLDPQAGASTSSARGLFQFVEQTWLGTMKQSGAALGYGRYADAIRWRIICVSSRPSKIGITQSARMMSGT